MPIGYQLTKLKEETKMISNIIVGIAMAAMFVTVKVAIRAIIKWSQPAR